MASYKDLQLNLSEILQSKYQNEVRSKDKTKIANIKEGGDEKYFNLSPNENFAGCMINLTISNDGKFRLGASIGKIRHRKKDIEDLMYQLTSNQPEHGTDRTNKCRDDILRCTISTDDRHSAASLLTRFYDLTEAIIKTA